LSLLFHADTLTVTAELVNTGNTILTFSADNDMTCNPAAGVNPGGKSTCSWSITSTQSDLDFGSISRSFTFAGTPNVKGVSGESNS
jgi:hypothetical protein